MRCISYLILWTGAKLENGAPSDKQGAVFNNEAGSPLLTSKASKEVYFPPVLAWELHCHNGSDIQIE